MTMGHKCDFCDWTNVESNLNIGDSSTPLWICHGCVKRIVRGFEVSMSVLRAKNRGQVKHVLKTEFVFFQDIQRGKKKFEIRLNDRDFRTGDSIQLVETIDGVPTGNVLPDLQIQYILFGPTHGLPSGYVILNW